LEYQQQARLQKEKTLGPDDLDVAGSINNISLTLNALGRSKEALEMNDLCLRIRRHALGTSHPQTAQALNNRGEILLSLHDAPHALEAYREAGVNLEREFGPTSASVAYTLTGIGRALVDLARSGEALEPLKRALRIRQKEDPDEARLGETGFALARAMWASSQDPAAMTIAQTALKHYRQAHAADSQSEIVAWLSARHHSSRRAVRSSDETVQ
jgi:tetratricopeptide (TPR) repeat protein